MYKLAKYIAIVIIATGAVCLLANFWLSNTQNKNKAGIIRERSDILDTEPKDKSLSQEQKLNTTAAAKKVNQLSEITAYQNKEILSLIEKLGSGNTKECQEAAEKLLSRKEEALPLLLAILPESEVALKGQVIFLLGRMQDKAATGLLIEMMDDENSYIRRNAAEALGKIQDNSALFCLSNGLFDEDTSVKERSAMALGQLQDSGAVENLLNLFSFEKEDRVKSAAVKALGMLKDERATLTLLSELKSQNDQSYKDEIVCALGEIGDLRALEGLKNYVKELKQYKPTDKMFLFRLEESIRAAEKTIDKIQEINSINNNS